MRRETTDNRRIRRARGFQRAWLIAEHLNRLTDGASFDLTQTLLRQWLARQGKWA